MASPLFTLRKYRWFQRLTLLLDRRVSVRALGLPFPVTMRLGPNFTLATRLRKEAQEREAFRQLLERLQPRVFWDVGANIGIFGFAFAARFPERPCLMIEPDPANLACLRQTKEQAGLEHTTLLEAAVSDRDGSAAFALDPLTSATGQLVDGTLPFVERHHGFSPPLRQVRTVTLDSLLDAHAPPDLVKIDIEQHEATALQGAAKLLREVRPVILIELSGGRSAAGLLREAGYVLTDWHSGQPAPEGAWATLASPRERSFPFGEAASV